MPILCPLSNNKGKTFNYFLSHNRHRGVWAPTGFPSNNSNYSNSNRTSSSSYSSKSIVKLRHSSKNGSLTNRSLFKQQPVQVCKKMPQVLVVCQLQQLWTWALVVIANLVAIPTSLKWRGIWLISWSRCTSSLRHSGTAQTISEQSSNSSNKSSSQHQPKLRINSNRPS